MKLVLIGLRGTGKTTVGQLLAARLEWPFSDTDALIETRAGLTIREIFARKGEDAFRILESQIVQERAQADRVVLATGGGAVLDPANVSALKQNGFVVHLSADPEELWRRISQDRATAAQRPVLLPGAVSGLDELKKLLLARAALYARARDAEVSVEDRSPDEIVDAILILMRAHGVGV